MAPRVSPSEIKQRYKFLLRDFRGVDPEYIARLEAVGIKKTGDMLTYGATSALRATIALMAEVPEAVVTELVKLADLSRLPGVKGIRARLYFEAGVDTVEKMASWEPQALLGMTNEFVRKNGFDGIPPLPKEVSSTIANARAMPKIAEW